MSARIDRHFGGLSDPRRGKTTCPLIEVVTIAVCAVICGADDFVAVAKFGRAKREWFAKFLEPENGIPSHDRFNAIFAALGPAQFEKCPLSFITDLHQVTDGQVIAIDGKTLRRSYDAASSKSAIHMVSAWAAANRVSLGQAVVDAESNETTAIPELLEMLETSGCFVTIDAMGRQTKIAQTIVDGAGRYRLAAKENQPTPYRGIEDFFFDHLEDDFARTNMRSFETHEKGHGRETDRRCCIRPVPDDLPDRSRWPKLKAVGTAVSHALRDGEDCNEVRCCILSRYCAGRRFGEAVREHWGIENSLHRRLDVTFQEDQRRIRKGNADADFSILRRTALSLLKQEPTAKAGIKNKRLQAGWNEEHLEKVLLGQ